MLSGLLVVLAFPRYGEAWGLDLLVFVAPVPLFAAACAAGGRRGFRLGWLAGMVVEGAGFLWILHAIRAFTQLGAAGSAAAFLIWVLWSTLPWGVLGWALGGCRRAEEVLGVIPLWVALEHFYPRLFPWHLGGALHGRSVFLQGADLFGASGLTALVLLVACALHRTARWAIRRGRAPTATLAVAAVLLLTAIGYGHWREGKVAELERAAPRLRVAWVQGNVDPRELPAGRSGVELDLYLERSEDLLARQGPVDLLLWPEGVIPYPFVLPPGPLGPWALFERNAPAGVRRRLESLGSPLLAGGSGIEVGREGKDLRVRGRYNVAVYLRPGEAPRFYRKNHRLLFGEYVPLLDLLSERQREEWGLRHIATIEAGEENPLLECAGRHFRALICYEAILPSYVRSSALGADFLANITEDVWYGRTSHTGQHLSVLRLRAVESRIPIVRCTNVGPSGVLRASGRFESSGATFVEEARVAELPAVHPASLYERGGHWFPALAGVAWILAIVVKFWRRGRDAPSR